MQGIKLAEKLAQFEDHWQPRVVGQFNGHDLMLVKVKGEFVWHTHDEPMISSLSSRDVYRFNSETASSTSARGRCSSFQRESSIDRSLSTRRTFF